jgi:hypothetical protein
LHPDRYQSDQDNAQVELSNRQNTRSVKGLNASKKRIVGTVDLGGIPAQVFNGGRSLKHGDQFTLYGQKAIDIRNKFAAGPWNDFQPTGGLGGVLVEIAYGDEVPR